MRKPRPADLIEAIRAGGMLPEAVVKVSRPVACAYHPSGIADSAGWIGWPGYSPVPLAAAIDGRHCCGLPVAASYPITKAAPTGNGTRCRCRTTDRHSQRGLRRVVGIHL